MCLIAVYLVVREFKSLRCGKISKKYLRILTLEKWSIKCEKALISQGFSWLHLFCSLFLAEKERFELSRRDNRPTPLAGAPLRPLEYFSGYSPRDAVCILSRMSFIIHSFTAFVKPFFGFFGSIPVFSFDRPTDPFGRPMGHTRRQVCDRQIHRHLKAVEIPVTGHRGKDHSVIFSCLTLWSIIWREASSLCTSSTRMPICTISTMAW